MPDLLVASSQPEKTFTRKSLYSIYAPATSDFFTPEKKV
jgi:hypothetical protein